MYISYRNLVLHKNLGLKLIIFPLKNVFLQRYQWKIGQLRKLAQGVQKVSKNLGHRNLMSCFKICTNHNFFSHQKVTRMNWSRQKNVIENVFIVHPGMSMRYLKMKCKISFYCKIGVFYSFLCNMRYF